MISRVRFPYTMANAGELVLVTGGSGFVGSHCVVAALNAGYRVRTTVRSLPRADDVRAMLRVGGVSEDKINKVEFHAVDLTKDAGWTDACRNCTYVLHVASPFPSKAPKNEDDLIVPARDGTLRALRAAKAASTVRRVVLTSSSASIVYGHPTERLGQGPFTEEDWTNIEDPATPIPAYQKSKTLAELAAWDWIAKEGRGMEMATIHPCGIYGPLLSTNYATSVQLVEWCLNGTMPALPQIGFGVIDVRDVADLHIRAMTDPNAKGERFFAVPDDYIDVPGVAEVLRRRLGEKAKRVPTRVAPIWFMRIVSWFDPMVADMVPEMGKRKEESNAKAKRVLGWQPKPVEEALLATAESLESFGLLK